MTDIFLDRTRAIITRSGTMRPQDVADGILSAVAILEENGYVSKIVAQPIIEDLQDARDTFVSWTEREGSDGFDIESAQASHDSLSWEIEDAASWVGENAPVGWLYEVNENDPAEAGFYPCDSEGYPIDL